MVSTYEFPATNGPHIVPHNSLAMDRTVSISYHTTPTAGAITASARPFGRGGYIPIDGASLISAEAEATFTVSYPMADMMLTLTGVAGGTLITVTIADGVA